MATNNLVKVIANYAVDEPKATLWGVDFTADGAGVEARYVAVIDAELAKSLIDASRAIKAK